MPAGLASIQRLSIQTGRRMGMSIFTNLGHVSQDALSLQVLDDLPVRWVLPVEQHLCSCHRCQVALTEMKELIAALRMLAKQPPPRDRPTPMVN
jgi:hypothetical protein